MDCQIDISDTIQHDQTLLLQKKTLQDRVSTVQNAWHRPPSTDTISPHPIPSHWGPDFMYESLNLTVRCILSCGASNFLNQWPYIYVCLYIYIYVRICLICIDMHAYPTEARANQAAICPHFSGIADLADKVWCTPWVARRFGWCGKWTHRYRCRASQRGSSLRHSIEWN